MLYAVEDDCADSDLPDIRLAARLCGDYPCQKVNVCLRCCGDTADTDAQRFEGDRSCYARLRDAFLLLKGKHGFAGYLAVIACYI